jgi:hypothetical protein
VIRFPLVPLLVIALAAVAVPAAAADRTIGIGSFDRLRVDGPFDVRVTGGASPSARLTGEREAIDAVELRVEGGTLIVRAGVNGWGERPGGRAAADGPIVVTLGTPALSVATANGGARVAVTRMRGDRVALSVTGAGRLSVDAVAATDLNATLVANGEGAIDADRLDAGDALVRLEGMGAIKARVRYTAQVSNPGLGSIDVAGPATCVVRGPAAGPVRCQGPRGN